MVSIRAIYEDGQLRLLDPVELAEGQVVQIIIEDELSLLTPDQIDVRLRSAGLLLDVNVMEDVAELTPEERRRIGQLFVGERSSEDLIDGDRDFSD